MGLSTSKPHRVHRPKRRIPTPDIKKRLKAHAAAIGQCAAKLMPDQQMECLKKIEKKVRSDKATFFATHNRPLTTSERSNRAVLLNQLNLIATKKNNAKAVISQISKIGDNSFSSDFPKPYPELSAGFDTSHASTKINLGFATFNSPSYDQLQGFRDARSQVGPAPVLRRGVTFFAYLPRVFGKGLFARSKLGQALGLEPLQRKNYWDKYIVGGSLNEIKDRTNNINNQLHPVLAQLHEEILRNNPGRENAPAVEVQRAAFVRESIARNVFEYSNGQIKDGKAIIGSTHYRIITIAGGEPVSYLQATGSSKTATNFRLPVSIVGEYQGDTRGTVFRTADLKPYGGVRDLVPVPVRITPRNLATLPRAPSLNAGGAAVAMAPARASLPFVVHQEGHPTLALSNSIARLRQGGGLAYLNDESFVTKVGQVYGQQPGAISDLTTQAQTFIDERAPLVKELQQATAYAARADKIVRWGFSGGGTVLIAASTGAACMQDAIVYNNLHPNEPQKLVAFGNQCKIATARVTGGVTGSYFAFKVGQSLTPTAELRLGMPKSFFEYTPSNMRTVNLGFRRIAVENGFRPYGVTSTIIRGMPPNLIYGGLFALKGRDIANYWVDYKDGRRKFFLNPDERMNMAKALVHDQTSIYASLKGCHIGAYVMTGEMLRNPKVAVKYPKILAASGVLGCLIGGLKGPDAVDAVANYGMDKVGNTIPNPDGAFTGLQWGLSRYAKASGKSFLSPLRLEFNPNNATSRFARGTFASSKFIARGLGYATAIYTTASGAYEDAQRRELDAEKNQQRYSKLGKYFHKNFYKGAGAGLGAIAGGAALGAIVGVESGPGLLATSVIGGVAGGIIGEEGVKRVYRDLPARKYANNLSAAAPNTFPVAKQIEIGAAYILNHFANAQDKERQLDELEQRDREEKAAAEAKRIAEELARRQNKSASDISEEEILAAYLEEQNRLAAVAAQKEKDELHARQQLYNKEDVPLMYAKD